MGLGQVAPLAAAFCAVALAQGPAEAARVTLLPADSERAESDQIGPTLDAFPSIPGKTLWFRPEVVLHNGLRLGSVTRRTREEIDIILPRSQGQLRMTETGHWTKFFPEGNAVEFTIDLLQGEGDRLSRPVSTGLADPWSRSPSISSGNLFVDAVLPTVLERSASRRGAEAAVPEAEPAELSAAGTEQQPVLSPSDGQAARKIHWAQVPLPAATWLFLSALAGLGAVGWYRRRLG